MIVIVSKSDLSDRCWFMISMFFFLKSRQIGEGEQTFSHFCLHFAPDISFEKFQTWTSVLFQSLTKSEGFPKHKNGKKSGRVSNRVQLILKKWPKNYGH